MPACAYAGSLAGDLSDAGLFILFFGKVTLSLSGNLLE